MTMRTAAILSCLLLAACQPRNDAPSLGPRPAEAIDPRLPVGSTEPPQGALTVADRIASLEVRLREGEAGFASALPATRAAVARAGAPGSESWVQAEEQLSLLERAHMPVAITLAELDRLVTLQIDQDGWASPSDRDAVERLMTRARAVYERQADTLGAMAASLR
ncbi:hypothetical protein WJS89_11210 [Sphingomicrobium sp. XHP0235]|uniref:hypothetical protein n=1 Tax=Sphingomicrobium aquimarinum TaxID=3133971 RepID=UPI0031FF2F8B